MTMVQGVVMTMAQDVVMTMAQDVVMTMVQGVVMTMDLDAVTTKTMVHGAEVQMMDPEGMTALDAGTTKVQGEGMRMEEDLITGGKVHEAAVVIATGTEEEAHHLGGLRTTVKNAVEEEEVAGVIVLRVVEARIQDAMTGAALTVVTIATGTEEEAHHLGGSRTTVKNAEEEEVGVTAQLVDVKTDLPGETTDVEVRVAAAVEGLGGVKRTLPLGQTIGAVHLRPKRQLLPVPAEGTMTATGKLSASVKKINLDHSPYVMQVYQTILLSITRAIGSFNGCKIGQVKFPNVLNTP